MEICKQPFLQLTHFFGGVVILINGDPQHGSHSLSCVKAAGDTIDLFSGIKKTAPLYGGQLILRYFKSVKVLFYHDRIPFSSFIFLTAEAASTV